MSNDNLDYNTNEQNEADSSQSQSSAQSSSPTPEPYPSPTPPPSSTTASASSLKEKLYGSSNNSPSNNGSPSNTTDDKPTTKKGFKNWSKKKKIIVLSIIAVVALVVIIPSVLGGGGDSPDTTDINPIGVYCYTNEYGAENFIEIKSTGTTTQYFYGSNGTKTTVATSEYEVTKNRDTYLILSLTYDDNSKASIQVYENYFVMGDTKYIKISGHNTLTTNHVGVYCYTNEHGVDTYCEVKSSGIMEMYTYNSNGTKTTLGTIGYEVKNTYDSYKVFKLIFNDSHKYMYVFSDSLIDFDGTKYIKK